MYSEVRAAKNNFQPLETSFFGVALTQGHFKHEVRAMKGKKFGRLTLIKFVERKNYKDYWVCKCDCGNIKTVYINYVINSITKSCGCYAKKVTSKRCKKHGMTNHRLYRIWAGMMSRCKYKRRSNVSYIRKGISVCDEWKEPATFFEWALSNGYDDELTIDRIDNNGNYEPSNCQWITLSENSAKTSQLNLLTFDGKTMSVTEWSKHLGIRRGTIYNRLSDGWSTERALTTPVNTKFRNIKYTLED